MYQHRKLEPCLRHFFLHFEPDEVDSNRNDGFGVCFTKSGRFCGFSNDLPFADQQRLGVLIV